MQPVSSRIWTRVAVFISYDNNNYTTGTFTSYLVITLNLGIQALKRYDKNSLTGNESSKNI